MTSVWGAKVSKMRFLRKMYPKRKCTHAPKVLEQALLNER